MQIFRFYVMLRNFLMFCFPQYVFAQVTELRLWSCSIDEVLANTIARQIDKIHVIRFHYCNLTDSAMSVISQSIKTRQNPVGCFVFVQMHSFVFTFLNACFPVLRSNNFNDDCEKHLLKCRKKMTNNRNFCDVYRLKQNECLNFPCDFEYPV